jgi:hypothetical protein
MIWDIHTVDKVKRAYTSLRVDMLRPDADKALAKTREHVCGCLIDYTAHKFGVTVHPVDVRFEVTPDMFVGRTEVLASWHPSTTAVELFGGPDDGQLLVVPRRHLFLRLLMPPAAMRSPMYSEAYDYAGWDDTTRRWVYRHR